MTLPKKVNILDFLHSTMHHHSRVCKVFPVICYNPTRDLICLSGSLTGTFFLYFPDLILSLITVHFELRQHLPPNAFLCFLCPHQAFSWVLGLSDYSNVWLLIVCEKTAVAQELELSPTNWMINVFTAHVKMSMGKTLNCINVSDYGQMSLISSFFCGQQD